LQLQAHSSCKLREKAATSLAGGAVAAANESFQFSLQDYYKQNSASPEEKLGKIFGYLLKDKFPDEEIASLDQVQEKLKAGAADIINVINFVLTRVLDANPNNPQFYSLLGHKFEYLDQGLYLRSRVKESESIIVSKSFSSDAYDRATYSDSTAIAGALSSPGVLDIIINDYLSGYQALTVERLQTASQKAADEKREIQERKAMAAAERDTAVRECLETVAAQAAATAALPVTLAAGSSCTASSPASSSRSRG
jgi:hypothetical protein